MVEPRDSSVSAAASNKSRLIYRQFLSTRITHWLWAVSLFFLLLSGLQIFNAHPTLYIGTQSGFAFDNAVLRITAERREGGLRGVTEVFGFRFDTTGFLGVSGRQVRAFPAWATIPSGRNLAFGRLVHFFFAWLLVATLLAWLLASLVNSHMRRDIVLGRADFRALPGDIRDHLRLKFCHAGRYGPLQKLAYTLVLFVLLPLMIASGLAMSPGMNASLPWLTEVLGGRQTARSLHFVIMLALVGFFLIHMAMVLLAGPVNLLRSMVTGWYRDCAIDPAVEGSKYD